MGMWGGDNNPAPVGSCIHFTRLLLGLPMLDFGHLGRNQNLFSPEGQSRVLTGVWFISIERERLGGENILVRGKNIARALGCVWLSRCVGGARGPAQGCTGYLKGTSLEAQVLLQERLVQQAKDCPTEMRTHGEHS